MRMVARTSLGISPKEFIKIARFQEVLRRLQQIRPQSVLQDGPGDIPQESLLRIAFELGYYDHAHLTNEFKRYAGIRPSELSHFYKTGIANGQYKMVQKMKSFRFDSPRHLFTQFSNSL
jgi:AraC-like DNA-binding protein